LSSLNYTEECCIGVNIFQFTDYVSLFFLCGHHQDGSCVVALGHRGEGETIRATQNKVSLVCPKKNERVKILGGKYCGSTAKVIGEDGQDGIVKLDESLDIKILKLTILAKLVHE